MSGPDGSEPAFVSGESLCIAHGGTRYSSWCPKCYPPDERLGAPPRTFVVSPGLAEAATRQLAADDRQARIADLERYRPTLIAYMKLKLDAEDWHGVQDAASDLRDLDSELDGLRL